MKWQYQTMFEGWFTIVMGILYFRPSTDRTRIQESEHGFEERHSWRCMLRRYASYAALRNWIIAKVERVEVSKYRPRQVSCLPSVESVPLMSASWLSEFRMTSKLVPCTWLNDVVLIHLVMFFIFNVQSHVRLELSQTLKFQICCAQHEYWHAWGAAIFAR